MFDKLFSELRKLEQSVSIPVTLPLDEAGYFDRSCPSPECRANFKVLFDDWENKVTDERVFCPICRFEKPADSWNTPKQEEYFEAVITNHVSNMLTRAMTEDAGRFNRQHQSGLISISLSVTAGEDIVIPTVIADSMQQSFMCESCGCQYASIGLAYFCPACGHNSVITTFDNTVDTVRQLINRMPEMTQAFSTVMEKDTAHNNIRYILEGSLDRLVGAFQYFAEYLFNQRPEAKNIKQRKNLFQNLSEGSGLWKLVTSKGYEDLLTHREMMLLEQLFQKRHLIAHRNGIVDQEYISKSRDTAYTVGQRIVISESNVQELAEILAKLASALRHLP